MKTNRHNLRRISKKKGSLEETLSYAIYKDDPLRYTVSYRDKNKIVEVNLKEFIKNEEYSVIPITRITLLVREGKLVWKKGQKELLIKD